MKNNSNRYQELDALRGLAALMVVFFHFTMGRAEAQLGFRLGTTGVDLFFIISGFVIYMSISKIKTSYDFIVNRISRLYPTYWACVTFTFILISLVNLYKQRNIPFIQYLGNMTMFQYFLNIENLDGPYWTMIIEMIFYIGIVLLFQFKILRYITSIGVISSVIIAICVTQSSNDIMQRLLITIPLFQFLPLFIAGTIFYTIYTVKGSHISDYILIIICFGCQIFLYSYAGKSRFFINRYEYSIMLSIYFLIFTLFVTNRLKFIVFPFSMFFGRISFALYLIHQYISAGLIIPNLVDKFNVNFWMASLLISLPIVVVLATLITYYIEIPLSRKMKNKLRSLTPVSLTADGVNQA